MPDQFEDELKRAADQVQFLLANCTNPDCPIGCPDDHCVDFPPVECGTFDQDMFDQDMFDQIMMEQIEALHDTVPDLFPQQNAPLDKISKP